MGARPICRRAQGDRGTLRRAGDHRAAGTAPFRRRNAYAVAYRLEIAQLRDQSIKRLQPLDYQAEGFGLFWTYSRDRVIDLQPIQTSAKLAVSAGGIHRDQIFHMAPYGCAPSIAPGRPRNLTIVKGTKGGDTERGMV